MLRFPTRLVGVAAAVVLGAGFCVADSASAQPVAQSGRSEALDGIRARVAELEGELVELGRAETSIEAELRRLELEYRLQSQLVAEAVAEREVAEEALRLSTDRVGALELATAETRARLAARIMALYRAAPSDLLRGFVQVRAPRDLFLYMRTVGFLARRDAELLPAFLREKAELESEQSRLEGHRREVVRSAARETRRLGQLRTARRKQALVVSALEKERARLEREAQSLDDKQRKLALLIAVLAETGKSETSEAPIQDFRGVLDWPLDGSVSIPFGPRYEARYGTSVPHNGIKLDPRSELVKTVFRGEVIFAARFEGFGRTVVVHHPTRVFSLYAGLDELEVVKGDIVGPGQVLGRTSAPLYFSTLR